MGNKYVNKKNLTKFVVGSGLGIFMFLFPIPQNGAITTFIDYVKNFIHDLLGNALPYVLLVLMVIAAVGSLYDTICKPKWIENNHYLKKAFSTTPFYLTFKIMGAIICFMVVFNIGPEFIIGADVGGTIVGLAGTLLCIVLGFSFMLPFLTDCGIMEFLGVMARPIVQPLFGVPGRASVDLIASWFGASNAAVILTREQYMKGFYTKREAAYIMTNFSLVSIPFCLLIANSVGVAHLFPAFYLIICVTGIILAIIIRRIPPICNIENTYQEQVGKQIQEDIPDEHHIFKYAVEMGCKRASTFTLKNIITNGMEVVMGMLFDLVPTVIAWGTLALIVATYTPLVDIISYPMGMYLKLFGIEEAFAAAPATLIGFTDMFIPALLLTGIQSVKTRFVVAALSLVQIIYLTEVGVIAIKSEVPLNFWKLLIIFLERTIIAIPLIVLFSSFVF